MNLARNLCLIVIVTCLPYLCIGQTAGNPPTSAAASPTIIFDPPGTAQRYAAQHEHEPYQHARFVRDLAYGAQPRNLLDVAEPVTASKNPRPVLIFVPGGQGNRNEVKGYLYYDNVLLWAVDQGYIGINMSRESGPGTSWDTGAKNIAAVISWTQQHIKEYGGDSSRIFIWGHSLGATALATYISHPEYYPSTGIGLKGAILFAGSYNLAPLKATQPGRSAPGVQAEIDAAILLAQSSLPGLQKTTLPLLLAAADGDPLDRPEYVTLIHDALCKSNHCPATLSIKGHDHFSEVFSINTLDQSVSGPVLEWLRSIPSAK